MSDTSTDPREPDLTTQYLGLRLSNPIIAAACPLTGVPETVERMAAAGAAAVVLPSVFEEQINGDPGLLSPDMQPYNRGPEDYLAHLAYCRERVEIPIIASVNGYSDGPWLRFAEKLEKAGAAAIEFNAYSLAGHPIRPAKDIEDRLCRVVGMLCSAVKVPVAVKLHPFYTSLPHLASRLVKEGARGVVLFNRFYYPDVEARHMRRDPTLLLSDRSELLLRLRWTTILSGSFSGDIAVTGGVHQAEDVVKSLMVGARAVQCASSLIKRGIEHLTTLRGGLRTWMMESRVSSVQALIGRAQQVERNLKQFESERSSYLEVLRAYSLSDKSGGS